MAASVTQKGPGALTRGRAPRLCPLSLWHCVVLAALLSDLPLCGRQAPALESQATALQPGVGQHPLQTSAGFSSHGPPAAFVWRRRKDLSVWDGALCPRNRTCPRLGDENGAETVQMLGGARLWPPQAAGCVLAAARFPHGVVGTPSPVMERPSLPTGDPFLPQIPLKHPLAHLRVPYAPAKIRCGPLSLRQRLLRCALSVPGEAGSHGQREQGIHRPSGGISREVKGSPAFAKRLGGGLCQRD